MFQVSTGVVHLRSRSIDSAHDLANTKAYRASDSFSHISDTTGMKPSIAYVILIQHKKLPLTTPRYPIRINNFTYATFILIYKYCE